MPINGLGPEMSCELLFPIAEATAIGAMGSDYYLGAIFSASMAKILEGHTKMNSVAVLIIITLSWVVTFFATFFLKDELNRWKYEKKLKKITLPE